MLKGFFSRYGWRYIPGALFIVLSTYIQSLAPQVLGQAIDLLSATAPQWEPVARQAWLIVLIALGVFVTRFIWRMFIIGNARTMENFLREKLFIKLQSLPLFFLGQNRTGDLMAYAVNDVGAVRMTFGPVLAMSLSGLTLALLSVYEMAMSIDSRMTLLALLPIPPAVILVILLGRKVQVRFRRVQELFGTVSGMVNETINGVKVIKSFAREEEHLKDFGETSGEMREANVKLANTSAWMTPVVTILFGVSYAVAIGYGGNLVLSGRLSLGELVAFNGYLLLVQNPITQLTRIVNLLERGMASLKRLNAIAAQPEIPAFEQQTQAGSIQGSIEARGLTYTYPDAQTPALRDISFAIPAGGRLGIAGATGSGKTTLAHLLLKLYNPPRESLFIDGVDIRDIPAVHLRGQMGYVPQDGFLFADTVERNIAFYQPGADMAAVEAAARMAQVAGDIQGFPQGYQTQVGERGTRLSGGQKQRVALARALVRDPAVLVLDDTLSAVDNHTEQAIVAALAPKLAGRTSITIAHRLSALAGCDLILFLADGCIVERGTHEQLLALGGQYAAIYREQQKGGQHIG